MKDVLSALFSTKQEPRQHPKKEVPDSSFLVDDQIACVGKLPLYADFLRHNLNCPEALALDKWLQAAFQLLSQKYRSNFKEIFDKFPQMEFVFFGSDTSKAVSGTMVAGKDQSGREYPFTIFKVLGMRVSNSQIPLMTPMLNHFIKLSIAVCEEDWSSQDKDLLFRRIDSLPVNEGEAGLAFLSSQSNSQLKVLSSQMLWDIILPESCLEERMEFVKVFNQKVHSIISLPDERQNWSVDIAIFNSDKREIVQHFFTSLVIRIMAGKPWNGQCWLTISGNNSGRLTLFFRPPVAEDFLGLVDNELSQPNMIKINSLLKCNSDTSHRPANAKRSTSNMAELIGDWAALFEKEKHQTRV